MASSIFGNGGGFVDKAVSTLNNMGVGSVSAGDAFMANLYRTNPQVRRIVDQYRGRNVADLLRERGVNPDEALGRFGK